MGKARARRLLPVRRQSAFLAGETFELSVAVHPVPVRSGPSGLVTYVPADPRPPYAFRLQALFVVPEPSALLLTMAGLLGIGVRRRG